jgi:hypothetical protein
MAFKIGGTVILERSFACPYRIVELLRGAHIRPAISEPNIHHV